MSLADPKPVEWKWAHFFKTIFICLTAAFQSRKWSGVYATNEKVFQETFWDGIYFNLKQRLVSSQEQQSASVLHRMVLSLIAQRAQKEAESPALLQTMLPAQYPVEDDEVASYFRYES